MDDRNAVTLLTHALADRWAHEDPWHELAVGALTREQVIAMRGGLESPEALERKLALFEPPTSEASDRILRALLEQHGSSDSSTPDSSGATNDGRVIPLRPSTRGTTRRSWRTTAFAGVVAAAASVLLVWSIPPAPEEHELMAELEPMPAFELQLHGGWSGDLRGADPAVDPFTDGCDQRYHWERSLSVRLHPSEALGDELSVAIFARPEAGEGHWIPSEALAPTLSDEGVLAIEQPVADLGLTVGAWTLTFYIARDGEGLELADLRSLDPGAHPGITVVQGKVCIVGE